MSFSLVFGSMENLPALETSHSQMSLAQVDSEGSSLPGLVAAGWPVSGGPAAPAFSPAASPAPARSLLPRSSIPVPVPQDGPLYPPLDSFLELIGKTRREAKAGSRPPVRTAGMASLDGRLGPRSRLRTGETDHSLAAIPSLPLEEETAEERSFSRSRSTSPEAFEAGAFEGSPATEVPSPREEERREASASPPDERRIPPECRPDSRTSPTQLLSWPGPPPAPPQRVILYMDRPLGSGDIPP